MIGRCTLMALNLPDILTPDSQHTLQRWAKSHCQYFHFQGIFHMFNFHLYRFHTFYALSYVFVSHIISVTSHGDGPILPGGCLELILIANPSIADI